MHRQSKLIYVYLILIFISGFAGLVYEVLWMKQLGLLFGNTSQAAGATLSAFFGGLAVGSWLWGRNIGKMKNPMRVYAWLEVGIAVTAVLYFFILHGYYAVYPLLYQQMGSQWWLLIIKFILAVILVFPPALFMGGTIPVIGQYLIQKKSGFGATAALLYGVNTIGAALGAFMAGFFFPLWFGFRITCMGAMALNGLVAVIAFTLSNKDSKVKNTEEQDIASNEGQENDDDQQSSRTWEFKRFAVMFICFISGFGFLALEVLWTRMFAQVLENSVYTFAAILVIVLICLSIGAFISSCLARLKLPPLQILATLLLLSGLAVVLTPFIFMQLTNSFQILAMRTSWHLYVLMIFKKGFLAIGPPALLLGTIFPFLMKSEEQYLDTAGKSLGRLSAINTTGAILGSLICGFLFLEQLGMWKTMLLLAVIYLVSVIILPIGWEIFGISIRVVACIILALAFTKLNPINLPVNSIDPDRHIEEKILETWEASSCTVAVAENNYGLTIKINSHYGLGSSGALRQQHLQTDIPLYAYPETKSIFYLGMGTGITAGKALDPRYKEIQKVVVCELVPQVITAAKKYMTNIQGYDLTNGLFEDPRVTLLAEDGRHYMMATDEKFDLVNGDLFVPFRSGVGSLYTKEHFQHVKDRLKPNGVFFQWIPLYQVTENELFIMARTMIEVFDQVSLWRMSFQPSQDIVAIVGHKGGNPLPACDIDNSADKQYAVAGKTYQDLDHLALPFDPQTILFFYCGNLTGAKELFAEYPVNTDDKPMIEYMAPRTYRGITESSIPWFVGPRLARLVEDVQRICPPEKDPLLINRDSANKHLPLAGTAFYRAQIWEMIGDKEKCKSAWQRFVKEWLAEDK